MKIEEKYVGKVISIFGIKKLAKTLSLFLIYLLERILLKMKHHHYTVNIWKLMVKMTQRNLI